MAQQESFRVLRAANSVASKNHFSVAYTPINNQWTNCLFCQVKLKGPSLPLRTHVDVKCLAFSDRKSHSYIHYYCYYLTRSDHLSAEAATSPRAIIKLLLFRV